MFCLTKNWKAKRKQDKKELDIEVDCREKAKDSSITLTSKRDMIESYTYYAYNDILTKTIYTAPTHTTRRSCCRTLHKICAYCFIIKISDKYDTRNFCEYDNFSL